MSQKTVTINGTEYDAHTGLPVGPSKAQTIAASKPATHSQAIHQNTQKSQTLNRRIVKKQSMQARPAVISTAVKAKSPAIARFAPHPAVQKPARLVSDFGPVAHPMAAKAQAKVVAKPPVNSETHALKPSQVIKQEAIHHALESASSHNKKAHKQKPGKLQKFISIGSVTLALFLLGGYFTYLNLPNLSVRVAAAQAGIDATYPEYRPDGYSLSGAVAYSQGKVSMKFASNTDSQNFTISQSKSSWDSTAVLDNFVKGKAGDNYLTFSERGLTIYTYGTNAAWVNGGILYTIDGDAPLSGDQIRRIAVSL